MIVYQPNPLLGLKRRFLVSPVQLHRYISTSNANKALQAAQNLITNKCTLKFRKYGKIDIYLK